MKTSKASNAGSGQFHRLVSWLKVGWHVGLMFALGEHRKPVWGKHELEAAKIRAELLWGELWSEDEKAS